MPVASSGHASCGGLSRRAHNAGGSGPYFDVDSHVLRARERRKLDRRAPAVEALLHDSPEVIVAVDARSGDRGTAEYNDRLGLERDGASGAFFES